MTRAQAEKLMVWVEAAIVAGPMSIDHGGVAQKAREAFLATVEEAKGHEPWCLLLTAKPIGLLTRRCDCGAIP